jgi:hypothetical protein
MRLADLPLHLVRAPSATSSGGQKTNNMTKAITLREIAAKFRKETDDFLHDPPNITDYKSFRLYYNNLAKCVIRAEVDPQFSFATKTASTLAYIGTVILLSLDRELKEKGHAGPLEDKFNQMVQQGGISLTLEQAALVLKQQESNSAIRLLTKFAGENSVPPPSVQVTEITDAEMITPVSRRISALSKRAKAKEHKTDNDQHYAF